jgi:hypothetical protein
MASVNEKPSNAGNQLPKLGILEEDDEFEEFPVESMSRSWPIEFLYAGALRLGCDRRDET